MLTVPVGDAKLAVPEFNAEKSLYTSARHYATVSWAGGAVDTQLALSAGTSAQGGVVLALPLGANGSRGACTRTCGTCQPDSNSPTGCSMPCRESNCEVADEPCRPCPGGCSNCTPEQGCCSGQCTNLKSDSQNCGDCGQKCPSGQTCCNGICVDIGSVLGQVCTGCIGDQCMSALEADSQLESGDVLIFVPTDTTGSVIDFVTGQYGYSHVGVVCGKQMFDLDNTNDPTVPQVEAVDLQAALQRGHVACRFGLDQNQAQRLCACVMAQVGERMDWLELVTFGAASIPGTEICTMLVMHCLDEIGFDRTQIGLGGFVSPNHIARVCHAPKGGPTPPPPPPSCCPPGTTCSCGGRCVRTATGGVACVDGACLSPREQCP